MKRISFVMFAILAAMLLSSCSMHLGLSSILNPSSTTAKPSTKKIKATHTPPAPQSKTAATPAAAADNTISLKDMAFTPNALQVATGTTVTWVNNDTVEHTVTSDTKLFDSGQIAAGGKFSYTFAQPGSYAFHCNVHTSMTGTITVK